MKIKKISLLICIVILMELLSLGVFAAPTEHDISTGDVVLTDSCGENCPGHVITGTALFTYEIQILSGEHQVTLKDVDLHCAYPGVAFTLEVGAKADVTIEGHVSLFGESGILSHGELNIFGDESSYLYCGGKFEAIHVTDDLTVKGGAVTFGTAVYPGEGANSDKYHIYGLLAEGDDTTVTFEDADVRVANNDYAEQQPYFVEDVEYGNIAAGGIIAPKLVLKNTFLDLETGDVFYEEGLTPKAVGIGVKELNVIDSAIEVVAGNCYDSIGILCTETANFVNSEVIATCGEARNESSGISASEIFAEGGVIYANGAEEGEESFGIHLIGSPNKFELVGGDVVARGETQGLISDDEDFAGVSYKADENGEPQVKTDLSGKEFLYGNPYKVSYLGGDAEAENLPADGIYYREQRFTLPKEIPTAEDYIFLGWEDVNGNFYEAEQDHEVTMNCEDTAYIAVWKCLGGAHCILHRFNDLNAKAWYHDGIEYCYESNMMQGMSRTTFEPDTAATRGMIVTTLYRLEGEPETEFQNDFSDVPADAWYTDAVNWAVDCGIAYGYEDSTFRPDQPATREEMAVFLCRMAEYYELDVTAAELPDRFADKDDVSEWAVPALAWAVEQEIIKGTDDETLDPQGNATRAQLATVLCRFEMSLIGEA